MGTPIDSLTRALEAAATACPCACTWPGPDGSGHGGRSGGRGGQPARAVVAVAVVAVVARVLWRLTRVVPGRLAALLARLPALSLWATAT